RSVHQAHVLQEILHLLPGHFHVVSLLTGLLSGLGRLCVAARSLGERVGETRQHGGRLVEGSQQLGGGRLEHTEELREHYLSRRKGGERLDLVGRQHRAVEEAPRISSFGSSAASLITTFAMATGSRKPISNASGPRRSGTTFSFAESATARF